MKNQSRVSLRTIAEQAGVTRMTVSLALRGKPGVSVETRRKVLKAARQQGYRPDPEVSKLMSRIRSRPPSEPRGGLVLLTSGPHARDWMDSRTERKFIDGAVARARDYGYSMEKLWMDEPGLSSERLMEIIWSRGIEGILVAPLVGHGADRSQRKLDMDFSRFSVVQISDTVEAPALNCAIHDQYMSMLRMLGRLEALGYRRMGLVLERALDLRVNRRWTAAFLQYRELHGTGDVPPPLVLEGADQKRFDRWFARHRPDVLISLDRFGLRLLEAHGLDIPHDLGYASLDLDGEDPEFPGLSGIDQNARLVGASAADMLVAAIHRRQQGIPLHPIRTEVEGSWVDGATTRPQ